MTTTSCSAASRCDSAGSHAVLAAELVEPLLVAAVGRRRARSSGSAARIARDLGRGLPPAADHAERRASGRARYRAATPEAAPGAQLPQLVGLDQRLEPRVLEREERDEERRAVAHPRVRLEPGVPSSRSTHGHDGELPVVERQPLARRGCRRRRGRAAGTTPRRPRAHRPASAARRRPLGEVERHPGRMPEALSARLPSLGSRPRTARSEDGCGTDMSITSASVHAERAPAHRCSPSRPQPMSSRVYPSGLASRASRAEQAADDSRPGSVIVSMTARPSMVTSGHA